MIPLKKSSKSSSETGARQKRIEAAERLFKGAACTFCLYLNVDETTLQLPEAFDDWMRAVSRYPMFDVWREGRLCSVRLVHILRPEPGSPWDIFAHWQRLREVFPPAWLPLGYDVFGNVLFWDLEGGSVYLAWRGYPSTLYTSVAPNLQTFIENLYYRPFA
jgi:hypothetical protein